MYSVADYTLMTFAVINAWLLVLETNWIQQFPATKIRRVAHNNIWFNDWKWNSFFFNSQSNMAKGTVKVWQQDWRWLTFVILYPGFNQRWASLPGFIHTIKSPGFPEIKGSSLPPTISTSGSKISPKKKYEWFTNRALNPEVQTKKPWNYFGRFPFVWIYPSENRLKIWW